MEEMKQKRREEAAAADVAAASFKAAALSAAGALAPSGGNGKPMGTAPMGYLQLGATGENRPQNISSLADTKLKLQALKALGPGQLGMVGGAQQVVGAAASGTAATAAAAAHAGTAGAGSSNGAASAPAPVERATGMQSYEISPYK
jgi:hypothetical protein